MENAFLNCGINLSPENESKFLKYYELLIYYNEKFNITAVTEKEEVYKKHFADSLLGLKYFNVGTLIDVGAGGGFPSLPLKIVNDKLELTLLEATGKKCEFLKAVVKELDLKNVSVINGRAEDYALNPSFREKFDYCTARAVAGLNTLCEYCLPFVKVGGKFIAYKGNAEEEIFAATNAISVLGGKLIGAEKTTLFGAERTLVEIQKTFHTDKKYPRGHGKERKNPL